MNRTPALRSVSVIIPVRDGVELLERCLTALEEQDYPSHLMEIIVVDNNSVQDVAAVVARHDTVVLLHESTPGSYAARNAALDAARGDVLAFTDADCHPDRRWLSAGVHALARATTDESVPTMVGGAVELVFPRGRPVSSGELYEALHGFQQEQYLRDERFAVTANMLTWRRSVEQIGRFDSRLRSGGDAQWGRRLADAGGTQRYAADAVVRHPARSSLIEMVRKTHRVAVGRVAVELGEGLSARGIARMVRWQGISLFRTARGSRSLPILSRPMDRLRYVTAFAIFRAVTAAVYCWAIPASIRGSSRWLRVAAPVRSAR